MKKLIIGILIGIALICSLFTGPLTSTSASGQTGQAYVPGSPDEQPDMDEESILGTLKQVGSEIDDKEIAGYYQRLIEQYDLDDNTTENDNLDPLPDINKIVRQSAILPLQEAGKTIQDEDIARFYHDFLEDVGWELD